MSLVYKPNRARGKRFHASVGCAAMLADIHRIVGLPLCGDDADISMSGATKEILNRSGLRSVRVPYKATREQTFDWCIKLMDFRRLDTEDLQLLLIAWRCFLVRCDGYTAE